MQPSQLVSCIYEFLPTKGARSWSLISVLHVHNLHKQLYEQLLTVHWYSPDQTNGLIEIDKKVVNTLHLYIS